MIVIMKNINNKQEIPSDPANSPLFRQSTRHISQALNPSTQMPLIVLTVGSPRDAYLLNYSDCSLRMDSH